MTTSTLTPNAPDSPDNTATAVIEPARNAAAPTPQGAYTSVRPTNVLGVVTLVLGVLGFAIIPVITGHIALSQIKRTGEEGRGITMAGLILGYIGLAGYVLAAMFFFAALIFGALVIR